MVRNTKNSECMRQNWCSMDDDLMPFSFCLPGIYLWHDQGKWVTCRKISKIPSLLLYFLITSKYFMLMQTPSQLDTWLQSYEEFVHAKNNINKRIWTLFLPISQQQYLRHPTLIMSHFSYYTALIYVSFFWYIHLQTKKSKKKKKKQDHHKSDHKHRRKHDGSASSDYDASDDTDWSNGLPTML